ncbi:hypothetical protein [Corynebacterium anserum]|uniref:Polysaccharide biosynthesis protein n=1 Tax=Corynebacterium anserum TaxID=2684406 RepID=A0A7G7YQK4_9CORY|nr:hypothetical protein [Corynebacterium anserum]QNH96774.1 hypothetical protein GP473_09075 [Corynebacterium anserum]
MSQKFKALRQLLAMGCGLGPGFLLPLVLAFRMDAQLSDQILALLTMSIVGTAAITVATESHGVAKLAWNRAHGIPYADAISSVNRTMLPKGAIATTLTAIITATSFLFSRSVSLSLAVWIFVLAIGVFVTCVASTYAAVLILNEKSHIPLALQGLRHVLLIVFVFLCPEFGIALVIAYVSGEILRTLILAFITRRFLATHSEDAAPHTEERHLINEQPTRNATEDGLYRQFMANGVSQGNVLIERTAISTQQAGSLTLYDVADKITFIFIQGAYSLSVLPKMGSWAQLAGIGSFAEARTRFNADMRPLLLRMTIVLIPFASISEAVSLFAPVHSSVATTASYLGILMLAAIPTTQVMAQTRFLVMLEGTRYLLPVTLVGLLIMFTVGLGLFSLIGVIGILVARLTYRIVTVFLFQHFIQRLAEPAE